VSQTAKNLATDILPNYIYILIHQWCTSLQPTRNKQWHTNMV